jgi:hypothetical protein
MRKIHNKNLNYLGKPSFPSAKAKQKEVGLFATTPQLACAMLRPVCGVFAAIPFAKQ